MKRFKEWVLKHYSGFITGLAVTLGVTMVWVMLLPPRVIQAPIPSTGQMIVGDQAFPVIKTEGENVYVLIPDSALANRDDSLTYYLQFGLVSEDSVGIYYNIGAKFHDMYMDSLFSQFGKSNKTTSAMVLANLEVQKPEGTLTDSASSVP